MGYDLNRFNVSVDPVLCCPICRRVLENPVLLDCPARNDLSLVDQNNLNYSPYANQPHVFCRSCLIEKFSSLETPRCPLDGKQFKKSNRRNLFQNAPTWILDQLTKLHVCCDNFGCKTYLPISDLDLHRSTCEFNPHRISSSSFPMFDTNYSPYRPSPIATPTPIMNQMQSSVQSQSSSATSAIHHQPPSSWYSEFDNWSMYDHSVVSQISPQSQATVDNHVQQHSHALHANHSVQAHQRYLSSTTNGSNVTSSSLLTPSLSGQSMFSQTSNLPSVQKQPQFIPTSVSNGSNQNTLGPPPPASTLIPHNVPSLQSSSLPSTPSISHLVNSPHSHQLLHHHQQQQHHLQHAQQTHQQLNPISHYQMPIPSKTSNQQQSSPNQLNSQISPTTLPVRSNFNTLSKPSAQQLNQSMLPPPASPSNQFNQLSQIPAISLKSSLEIEKHLDYRIEQMNDHLKQTLDEFRNLIKNKADLETSKNEQEKLQKLIVFQKQELEALQKSCIYLESKVEKTINDNLIKKRNECNCVCKSILNENTSKPIKKQKLRHLNEENLDDNVADFNSNNPLNNQDQNNDNSIVADAFSDNFLQKMQIEFEKFLDSKFNLNLYVQNSVLDEFKQESNKFNLNSKQEFQTFENQTKDEQKNLHTLIEACEVKILNLEDVQNKNLETRFKELEKKCEQNDLQLNVQKYCEEFTNQMQKDLIKLKQDNIKQKTEIELLRKLLSKYEKLYCDERLIDEEDEILSSKLNKKIETIFNENIFNNNENLNNCLIKNRDKNKRKNLINLKATKTIDQTNNFEKQDLEEKKKLIKNQKNEESNKMVETVENANQFLVKIKNRLRKQKDFVVETNNCSINEEKTIEILEDNLELNKISNLEQEDKKSNKKFSKSINLNTKDENLIDKKNKKKINLSKKKEIINEENNKNLQTNLDKLDHKTESTDLLAKIVNEVLFTENDQTGLNQTNCSQFTFAQQQALQQQIQKQIQQQSTTATFLRPLFDPSTIGVNNKFLVSLTRTVNQGNLPSTPQMVLLNAIKKPSANAATINTKNVSMLSSVLNEENKNLTIASQFDVKSNLNKIDLNKTELLGLSKKLDKTKTDSLLNSKKLTNQTKTNEEHLNTVLNEKNSKNSKPLNKKRSSKRLMNANEKQVNKLVTQSSPELIDETNKVCNLEVKSKKPNHKKRNEPTLVEDKSIDEHSNKRKRRKILELNLEVSNQNLIQENVCKKIPAIKIKMNENKKNENLKKKKSNIEIEKVCKSQYDSATDVEEEDELKDKDDLGKKEADLIQKNDKIPQVKEMLQVNEVQETSDCKEDKEIKDGKEVKELKEKRKFKKNINLKNKITKKDNLPKLDKSLNTKNKKNLAKKHNKKLKLNSTIKNELNLEKEQGERLIKELNLDNQIEKESKLSLETDTFIEYNKLNSKRKRKKSSEYVRKRKTKLNSSNWVAKSRSNKKEDLDEDIILTTINNVVTKNKNENNSGLENNLNEESNKTMDESIDEVVNQTNIKKSNCTKSKNIKNKDSKKNSVQETGEENSKEDVKIWINLSPKQVSKKNKPISILEKNIKKNKKENVKNNKKLKKYKQENQLDSNKSIDLSKSLSSNELLTNQDELKDKILIENSIEKLDEGNNLIYSNLEDCVNDQTKKQLNNQSKEKLKDQTKKALNDQLKEQTQEIQQELTKLPNKEETNNENSIKLLCDENLITKSIEKEDVANFKDEYNVEDTIYKIIDQIVNSKIDCEEKYFKSQV